jgi:hypothetical protein
METNLMGNVSLTDKFSKQQQIVYDIVADFSPIRTEKIKAIGLQKGVSCADRYLRWLQESGSIGSYYENGDSTKTWVIVKKDLFQ